VIVVVVVVVAAAAAAGMLPRTAAALLQRLRGRADEEGLVDVLRVSFIEIYMEKATDLLVEKPKPMRFMECPERGTCEMRCDDSVPVSGTGRMRAALSRPRFAARPVPATQVYRRRQGGAGALARRRDGAAGGGASTAQDGAHTAPYPPPPPASSSTRRRTSRAMAPQARAFVPLRFHRCRRWRDGCQDFTGSNAVSSRSHAVFILSLESHDAVNHVTKTSQLYCCDLAGSEVRQNLQHEMYIL
jgi:hypothetical protein